MPSTKDIGALRARRTALDAEVRRLTSQVALLEKRLEDGEDAAAVARHEAAAAKLDEAREELSRVEDELEAGEATREERAQATDELERLVDSFDAVARGVPELGELLAAMRLTLGALASARRLAARHEDEPELGDIVRALSEALLRLANTMATRAQVLEKTRR